MTKKVTKDVVIDTTAEKAEMPKHELQYAPILKGKAGELTGLSKLTAEVMGKMMPIIEIPPIPYDFVEGKPSKSLPEHLNGFIKKMGDSWVKEYPIVIDASEIDPVYEGTYTLNYVVSQLRDRYGLLAIPAVSLDTTSDVLQSIKDYVFLMIGRLCVRINKENVLLAETGAGFEKIFAETGVPARRIDLVLDLGDIRDETDTLLVSNFAINDIPMLNEFNSFILAMTSFPENLSDYDPDSMTEIPRIEWNVWRSLVAAQRIKRIPVFGDYAVSSSELTSIDPRIMTMSASLRYTYNDRWVIIKGRSTKIHGFGQFHDLCAKLVDSNYFAGADFSEGDRMIEEKSRREGGSGSATTWREIGTNHHLTVVTRQLSAIQVAV